LPAPDRAPDGVREAHGSPTAVARPEIPDDFIFRRDTRARIDALVTDVDETGPRVH